MRAFNASPLRHLRRSCRAAFACAVLCAACGCGPSAGNLTENLRGVIPFMPPSPYVDVGGRKLLKEEVAWADQVKALIRSTKINPDDPVAYDTLGQLFHRKGNYELAKEFYVKAVELDGTLSESHHNLGLIAIQEGRNRDALIDLGRAVKLSPDDARIHMRLGQAHAGLSETAQAQAAFDKALALDDEYTDAYLEKAKLLYGKRDYKGAEKCCRDALAHLPAVIPGEIAKESRGAVLDAIMPHVLGGEEPNPNTAKEEAAFDLALCLKAQGRLSEAMQELLVAETAKEGTADVLILKAELQEGLRDFDGAAATLEGMRTTFPDMAEVPKRLARLYTRTGKRDKAAEMRLAAAELDHSDRTLQKEAAAVAEAAGDRARAIAIYERLTRTDPNDVETLRKLAEHYDQAGIRRQAALTYQEIVNRKDDDMAARRRLGMLYTDVPGFQGRAVVQFMAVLKKDMDDAEVHRKLGELYLNTNALEKAEEQLRWAAELNKKDAVAFEKLGDLYRLQRQGALSVDNYQKALNLEPDRLDARLNLAKVLLSTGRREEAVAPLETYLKAKPDDADARRIYAETLRDLNRREEAVREYKTLAAGNPYDSKTNMELARLATLMGQRDHAAGMYEDMLERNPSNVDALRAVARLYDEMDQPLRSMYCWQRLLKVAPQDLEAQGQLAKRYKKAGAEDDAIARYERLGHAEAWRNVAFLRLKRADRQLNEGKKDEAKAERAKAIEAYRKVIELEKQDIAARYDLASLLRSSRADADRDEALKLYGEIATLKADEVRARLNLGNLYAEKGRLALAVEQYESILLRHPDHAGAHLGLGIVHRQRGKLDKAQEQYELAEKGEPNNKFVQYNLGLLHDYYLGNPEKARAYYLRFVELGGDAGMIPEPEAERPEPPPEAKPAKEAKAPAKPKDATIEPPPEIDPAATSVNLGE